MEMQVGNLRVGWFWMFLCVSVHVDQSSDAIDSAFNVALVYSICNVSCTSRETLLSHATGVKHKRRARAASGANGNNTAAGQSANANQSSQPENAEAQQDPAPEDAAAKQDDNVGATKIVCDSGDGQDCDHIPTWSYILLCALAG
jgi:hypothetical protein